MEVSIQFTKKVMQEKLEIFTKLCTLHQVIIHNFLWQNVTIFPTCKLLAKKLIYFGLRVSTNFGLGVSAQFEYKKLLMEKQQYL